MVKLLRWQQAQKRQKEKKRSRFAKKLFLVILLVLLVGSLVQIWRLLSGSVWDQAEQISLAFNSRPVLLVSFEPKEKGLIVLSIPENTQVRAIHGYGEYQAGSLWNLTKLEKREGEFFSQTFQEYLGVPVDGYLSWDNSGLLVGETQEAQAVKTFLTKVLSQSLSGAESNLNRWDRFWLWWGVRKVRLNKIEMVDLRDLSGAQELVLPDETLVWQADSFYLDQLMSQVFGHRQIKSESLAIGVYNGTGHSGLAKKAARLIDNIGGRIVEVGDGEPIESKCQLKSKKELAESETIRKLKKVFDCQMSEASPGKAVEVAITLGEDYWRELEEK